MYNQVAIDMLQPGDVLVVDLFGKAEGGTIVGDNLFYYVMKATKEPGWSWTGRFAISMASRRWICRPTSAARIQRDQQRHHQRHQRSRAHRQRHGDARRPCVRRLGRASTSSRRRSCSRSWTTRTPSTSTTSGRGKKFDEGKYKSSEIYASPKDPALKKEYEDYLKKRLEEMRKKYAK